MKKLAKIFLLIGTLTFASLSISTPLLHNHKIDFNNHYNCPAFVLNATFISFVFVFILSTLPKLEKTSQNIVCANLKLTLPQLIKFINNRAPPFGNL